MLRYYTSVFVAGVEHKWRTISVADFAPHLENSGFERELMIKIISMISKN